MVLHNILKYIKMEELQQILKNTNICVLIKMFLVVTFVTKGIVHCDTVSNCFM